MVLVFFLSKPAFAAVARNKAAPVGKQVDRQQAVVRAVLASGELCIDRKGIDLCDRKHGRSRPVLVAFPGDQRGAESPHNTGNIRPYSMDARDFFKTAQHGIVIKRTALHDHFFAELPGVCELDDFKEGIFNHRISKPGGNIRNRRAFLLRLLYLGIHKYSASCSKIDRMAGKQRLLCKVLYRIIQRFCKRLNKGAAARRAGFIQLHAVDRLIFNTDTFHILSADIQNTIHIRVKKSGCIIMGNRLNLPFIQLKRSLNERFAVSGRAGMYDPGMLRQPFIDFLDGADTGSQGIAVIICIKRV